MNHLFYKVYSLINLEILYFIIGHFYRYFIYRMIQRFVRPLSLIARIRNFNRLNIKNLNNVNNQYFAYKKPVKEENMGSILIRNDNLKFNTQNFDLIFYPFHPQVSKKTATVYEINKLSSVIALNFIPKSAQGTTQTAQTSKANWQNRKSIAYRFNQLAPFLQVKTNQDGKWQIEIDRFVKQKNTKKILTFISSKKSQHLQISLEQLIENKSAWKINTKISNSEFLLFQFLLKESLYDLSGMRLMFDLRRNQELAKMTEKDKVKLDKQNLFKDYQNKENLV